MASINVVSIFNQPVSGDPLPDLDPDDEDILYLASQLDEDELDALLEQLEEG